MIIEPLCGAQQSAYFIQKKKKICPLVRRLKRDPVTVSHPSSKDSAGWNQALLSNHLMEQVSK